MALSRLGKRVGRSGVFFSRGGSAEGVTSLRLSVCISPLAGESLRQ